MRETITGSASRKGSGGRGDRGAEGADTPDVERGALEPRFSQAMEVDADVGARDASPARSTKRARVSSGKSILFVGFDCPKVRERQRHMDSEIEREGGREGEEERGRERGKEGGRERDPMGTNVNIRAQEAKERDEKFVPWLKSNGAVVAKNARDCTHLITPKIKTSCNFLVLSSVANLCPCPHSHTSSSALPTYLLCSLHTHASKLLALPACLSFCLPGCECSSACMHMDIYAVNATNKHAFVRACTRTVCDSSGRRAHCDASVAQRLHQQPGLCASRPAATTFPKEIFSTLS